MENKVVSKFSETVKLTLEVLVREGSSMVQVLLAAAAENCTLQVPFWLELLALLVMGIVSATLVFLRQLFSKRKKGREHSRQVVTVALLAIEVVQLRQFSEHCTQVLV